jgi:hypothetical protein
MKEWIVEIQGEALTELQQCFNAGPLFEHGQRDTAKHFVAAPKGLKIEIFSNEHPPPHFRVKHGGETNSFRIDDGTPLKPNGDLMKYFRNVKKWHRKNKDLLIEKWNETRPSGCPVGMFATPKLKKSNEQKGSKKQKD